MFCECKINHFFWNDKIESLLFFICLHAFPLLSEAAGILLQQGIVEPVILLTVFQTGSGIYADLPQGAVFFFLGGTDLRGFPHFRIHD